MNADSKPREMTIAQKYAWANALGVRAAVTGNAEEAAEAKRVYEEAKAEEAAIGASGTTNQGSAS